jgi:hypothetical protein
LVTMKVHVQLKAVAMEAAAPRILGSIQWLSFDSNKTKSGLPTFKMPWRRGQVVLSPPATEGDWSY